MLASPSGITYAFAMTNNLPIHTRKKRVVFTLLTIVVFSCITFTSMSPLPPPSGSDGGSSVRDFHNDPPIPLNFWVTKMTDSTLPGNMLLEIEFAEDTTLPDSLLIYYAGDSTIFRDNGTNGDSIADDYVYSAYIAEDTAAFHAGITKVTDSLESWGAFTVFNGHTGQRISGGDIQLFDWPAFSSGASVSLPLPYTKPIGSIGFDCNILRENSLFITDLDVVGYTTPPTQWAFGTLMKNMANCSGTNCTRNFIKQWLKNWTSTQNVNWQNVGIRSAIIDYVIGPWLGYCGSAIPGQVTMTNWETIWDGTSESAILANAPFKLTTIVNRIDLRGSMAFPYSPGGAFNPGETRFIFSLITPCDLKANTSGGLCTITGQYGSPKQPNQVYNTVLPDYVDWQGMNVIFEYGNTQTNICDLRTFAQQWLSLSTLTRNSTAYMDALTNVTNTVTIANAASGKPNGSALNRLRTNERILFAPGVDWANYLGFTNYNHIDSDALHGPGHQWEEDDWEFRQFVIDPSTHFLIPVTLTNTPIDVANYAANIDQNAAAQVSSFSILPDNTAYADNLIDWVYNPQNKFRVLHGTHTLPLMYNSLPLASAVSHVNGKYAHFWDFDWWNASTTNYNSSVLTSTSPNPTEKMLRHQLSLNTCSGCHAGETKTEFTQIRPLGYNEHADYWSTNPSDYTLHEIQPCSGAAFYRSLDPRFKRNIGSTYESGGNVLNYDETTAGSNQYHVKVSAFLTGRTYKGTISPTYDDDFNGDTDDASLDGLFYVNDPANDATHTPSQEPLPNDTKYGYNDLLRRKNDLCSFSYSACKPTDGDNISKILGITRNISNFVFAPGSH